MATKGEGRQPTGCVSAAKRRALRTRLRACASCARRGPRRARGARRVPSPGRPMPRAPRRHCTHGAREGRMSDGAQLRTLGTSEEHAIASAGGRRARGAPQQVVRFLQHVELALSDCARGSSERARQTRAAETSWALRRSLAGVRSAGAGAPSRTAALRLSGCSSSAFLRYACRKQHARTVSFVSNGAASARKRHGALALLWRGPS